MEPWCKHFIQPCLLQEINYSSHHIQIETTVNTASVKTTKHTPNHKNRAILTAVYDILDWVSVEKNTLLRWGLLYSEMSVSESCGVVLRCVGGGIYVNVSVVENKEMSGNLQKGVHVVEQVKWCKVFSGRGFRMIVCGIYESSITITSA